MEAAFVMTTHQGEPKKWLNELFNSLDDKCAIWPFATYPSGHAKIYDHGKIRQAYRVAWEWLHDMPWPETLVARHLCHRGADGCVNPYHVKPGTRAQNDADIVSNGSRRQPSNAKLTPALVLLVRQRLQMGEQRSSIAADLGVDQSTINAVARGQNWAWVTASHESSTR